MRAVLFDLDGTLADTAPDLAGALNRLLVEQGRQPIPLAQARPLTSSGARGMLKAGLDIEPGHADYDTLKNRFLDFYQAAICVDTQLFAGVDALLDEIEGRNIKWGVVTNKAQRFTHPLVRELALFERAGCVVCGDTTAKSKPFPEPLLHGAQLLDVPPAECLYVGDDIRDVQAARAAGMPVIVAGYGYLGDAGDPRSWGADAIITHPREVLNYLSATPSI